MEPALTVSIARISRLELAVHQMIYQVGILVELDIVTIRHLQPVRFQGTLMAVELVNSVSIRRSARVIWVKGLIVFHTGEEANKTLPSIIATAGVYSLSIQSAPCITTNADQGLLVMAIVETNKILMEAV